MTDEGEWAPPFIAGSGVLRIVLFSVAGQLFAFDAAGLVGICQGVPRGEEIAAWPWFVHGCALFQGEPIPLVDLCAYLKLLRLSPKVLSKVLVTECDDTLIGYVVDQVCGITTVPMTAIAPPSPHVLSAVRRAVKGSLREGERTAIVLDHGRLFQQFDRDLLRWIAVSTRAGTEQLECEPNPIDE